MKGILLNRKVKNLMKTTTLKELSDLSNVISQLKTIINTSGLSRFTKPQIMEMRNKLTMFEQMFLTGAVEYQAPTLTNHIAKDILLRTETAKKELYTQQETKAVVVGSNGVARTVSPGEQLPPEDMGTSINIEPVQITKLESSVPESLAKEIPVSPSKNSVDPEMAKRLAEAKKDLVKTGKRKSTKTK